MRKLLAWVLIALVGVALPGLCFAGKFTDWQTGSKKKPDSDSTKRKLPKIKRPVLFNTPAADRLLVRMQIFPKDNPWNRPVHKLPVRKNSRQIIAAIDANGSLAYNSDMNFIIVPPDQKKVPLRFTRFPGESDKGPFPIPNQMPIEGWPMSGGDLATYQRQTGGDRHAIIVDPWNGRLYEFYQARRTDTGWEAGCAAAWDLSSNKLRPKGWTSSDAAGLPIFPSIVRYDDVARGIVRHCMRVTVPRTRNAYVYPARHIASGLTDPNLPRMGERLRLRRNFDVSRFHPHAQAVLRGLQKYGMMVADHGGAWRISVAPDRRIKGLRGLSRVRASDFEVVETERAE